MKAFSTKISFLMIAFCFCFFPLITSNSTSTTCSTIDQPLEIKSAAITNYKLDLNITWGGSHIDYGNSIALDGSGNIYITGYTDSYDAGIKDAFIAKYDSLGNSLLNITWGGNNDDYGNDIALDDSGNIYITGMTNSFGVGFYDVFIAKYDSSGNYVFDITWGGSKSEYGYNIVLDDSGNIYIVGHCYSFGAGSADAFIAKYDSSGNSLLNITWGGSLTEYGTDIIIDDAGNIYITGRTNSFGAGNYDAFIAKYDSSGNSLLNITWGGSNFDQGRSIALDDQGNIYIAGETESFGAGNEDAFIAKYDSSGNSLLNITWGGSQIEYGTDIIIDDSGNSYITGYTTSFGAGVDDAFIAKYDSLGNSLLNITWGDSNSDFGRSIALDGSGNIYITGETKSFGAGDSDAFIAKYKAIYSGIFVIDGGDDDDDDDDVKIEFLGPSLIIIGIISAIGLASVVIYIIRKRR